MLSDLRSPGRIGRPAGADLVGTYLCGRRQGRDLRHTLPARHKHAVHVLWRWRVSCNDAMHVLRVSKHERPLRGSFFCFFRTRRIARNSRKLRWGLGAWATTVTTAGNTNGGVEAWYIAPKILLGICMGASSTSFFITTAVLCSRHQSIDHRQPSGQSRKKGEIPPMIPQT